MIINYKDISTGEWWNGVADLQLKSRLIRRLEQMVSRTCVEVTCSRPWVVQGDMNNGSLNSQDTVIKLVFQGMGLFSKVEAD